MSLPAAMTASASPLPGDLLKEFHDCREYAQESKGNEQPGLHGQMRGYLLFKTGDTGFQIRIRFLDLHCDTPLPP